MVTLTLVMVLFTVVYMIQASVPILPVYSSACPHLYLHSTKCTALPQYSINVTINAATSRQR